MRKLIAITTAAAALIGTASFANAGSLGQPCTTAPKDQWLPMEKLQKKVEEVGFKVQKSKLKNDCAEFYVTAQPGTRMELFVDPATGTIIGGV
jgi:hypothetical protein